MRFRRTGDVRREFRRWLADGAPQPAPNTVRSVWFLASVANRWRREIGPLVRRGYRGSWDDRRPILIRLAGIFTDMVTDCLELALGDEEVRPRHTDPPD